MMIECQINDFPAGTMYIFNNSSVATKIINVQRSFLDASHIDSRILRLMLQNRFPVPKKSLQKHKSNSLLNF